jgi:hypothetical protein
MTHLITHILATFAVFSIVSESNLPGWHQLRSYLSGKSETFMDFIHCPLCAGFWISLLISVAYQQTTGGLVPGFDCLVPVLGLGFAGAAGTYLLDNLMAGLQTR